MRIGDRVEGTYTLDELRPFGTAHDSITIDELKEAEKKSYEAGLRALKNQVKRYGKDVRNWGKMAEEEE